MAYNEIHQFIAAISPETYCIPTKEDDDGNIVDLVKSVRKTTFEKGFAAAKKEAKIRKAKELDLFSYDEAKKDAWGLWGLKSPIEEHKITYDSPAEGLEPIYFWILDFINGPYQSVEKLVDNFQSSPGSGHFSELQGKATQMQQEVGRTMGNVNTVIKSVLNLIYDLKEFKLRLAPYREYKKATDPQDKFNKLLALKQVWLDNVDIKKGRGSINALSSGELDFVTLRDGFMAADSLEHIKNLDLNERVKRILIQRAEEFFRWIDESYISLKQRYRLEKNYLKSQFSTLQLYARWVRPYLEAAQKLQRKMSGNANTDPRLVTAFNSTIFELVLFATSEYDVSGDVIAGLLPDTFKKVKTRKYYKVLVVEFDFRSIPQRISQKGDWAFGGKTDLKFTSYALNNEEIDVLKKELAKDEMALVMGLIDGVTEDSLKQIEKDIDIILKEKDDDDKDDEMDGKKKEEKKEEPKGENYVPDDSISGIFKPLWEMFKSKSKEAPKTKDPSKGILPDNEYEKVIRSQAAIDARDTCFTVFDVYKKSHGMPSHQSHFDVQ
ncbi:MAG: hypothetical protein ACP5NS_00645 [Candidatus Pacearchaeota archaeon]